MERQEIIDMLSLHKQELSQRFWVDAIALFGSSVRDESTPASDIDLLVEFTQGHKDFFNFIRCRFYLENLFKHKVDLVMKSAVKPRLRKQIFRQAEYV